MAANVNVIQGARIIHGGGPIVHDMYIGDNASVYKKGMIGYVSDGKIVTATGGAAAAMDLDTTDTIFDAARKRVIVLEDSAATTGYLKVQEITRDTEFEGYVIDTGSGGVVTKDTTDIGDLADLYQDANGQLAVDDTTANGVAYIQDVDVNYDPYYDPLLEKDSTGVRHSRVRFKINPALCL